MNNFAVITKAEQDVAKAKAHLSVLKQKINDSKAKLEEAKKDYSNMIKEFNEKENKQHPCTWSNKPVIRDFISLLITFHAEDKSFQSVLSVGFHDADNDSMETEGSIFMDLSSYATELKDMARKALEERFF